MTDPLLYKPKNGTCPFTGQRHDRARCELKPEERPIPSRKRPGFSEIHCCFGGCFLPSERAAVERAAAEPVELSEREKAIIRGLSYGEA